MEQLAPGAAGIKPLAALAPVMPPVPHGPAAHDVSSYSGSTFPFASLDESQHVEESNVKGLLLPGSPGFSRVPLPSPGHCGHQKAPPAPEPSLGTWSQSGLDGPRGIRKGRERSYHFQEAVNPKGMCQNFLATPRDREIETIYFLQGPLSRFGSWGSPSSDLEKSPRIHCFTQLDPNG